MVKKNQEKCVIFHFLKLSLNPSLRNKFIQKKKCPLFLAFVTVKEYKSKVRPGVGVGRSEGMNGREEEGISYLYLHLFLYDEYVLCTPYTL